MIFHTVVFEDFIHWLWSGLKSLVVWIGDFIGVHTHTVCANAACVQLINGLEPHSIDMEYLRKLMLKIHYQMKIFFVKDTYFFLFYLWFPTQKRCISESKQVFLMSVFFNVEKNIIGSNILIGTILLLLSAVYLGLITV